MKNKIGKDYYKEKAKKIKKTLAQRKRDYQEKINSIFKKGGIK